MSILRYCLRTSLAALAIIGIAAPAHAQKEIKVGVIYDHTGAFAAGGSLAARIGTKAAIDMINERGGRQGYRIQPIYADPQTKAAGATHTRKRPIDQEQSDTLMG